MLVIIALELGIYFLADPSLPTVQEKTGHLCLAQWQQERKIIVALDAARDLGRANSAP